MNRDVFVVKAESYSPADWFVLERGPYGDLHVVAGPFENTYQAWDAYRRFRGEVTV